MVLPQGIVSMISHTALLKAEPAGRIGGRHAGHRPEK
jgi:hypothetical protein